MCGIAGYLDKTKNEQAPVGQTLFKMLQALGRRGPDSAGVAVFNNHHDGDFVLRVKLGDQTEHALPQQQLDQKGKHIAEQMQSLGPVGEVATTAEYLRLAVDFSGDPKQLEQLVESSGEEVEVVSMGRSLEIVKQVGSPQNLDTTHHVSTWLGSHGIGHTRLCTESIIDLSHSQPFWAHGYPDLATVHNGHITNYHKLRRQYEQRGVKFYTENDSEIIGMYLADRLLEGMTLAEAMKASLVDLDGSFSYFVATPEAIGYARDPFALKPLLFTETETFVALATEEIAIRAAFDGDYEVREAQANEVRVWQR
ncbi:MAG: glutamine phosphoribosylpyrophosphate amidotransferase [Chloroflexi bacterium]|nr:glutamine phosphoribosylpyrophosphate amidotransferase [Chloroflexota bacterium]